MCKNEFYTRKTACKIEFYTYYVKNNFYENSYILYDFVIMEKLWLQFTTLV